jgi:membrane-bound ClpP family serine protease
VAKKFIRAMVMFLTAIWGLFFGLLGSINMLLYDMGFEFPPHVPWVWLIMTLIGYFTPCLLIMFDRVKIAAAFSAAGTILMLYIHSVFSDYIRSVTYLPQIFVTILVIIYIFVVNPHYITEPKKTRKDKLNAPAPSILGDGNVIPSSNKNKSKQKYKSKKKRRK